MALPITLHNLGALCKGAAFLVSGFAADAQPHRPSRFGRFASHYRGSPKTPPRRTFPTSQRRCQRPGPTKWRNDHEKVCPRRLRRRHALQRLDSRLRRLLHVSADMRHVLERLCLGHLLRLSHPHLRAEAVTERARKRPFLLLRGPSMHVQALG
jgi:hypothetical protein